MPRLIAEDGMSIGDKLDLNALAMLSMNGNGNGPSC